MHLWEDESFRHSRSSTACAARRNLLSQTERTSLQSPPRRSCACHPLCPSKQAPDITCHDMTRCGQMRESSLLPQGSAAGADAAARGTARRRVTGRRLRAATAARLHHAASLVAGTASCPAVLSFAVAGNDLPMAWCKLGCYGMIRARSGVQGFHQISCSLLWRAGQRLAEACVRDLDHVHVRNRPRGASCGLLRFLKKHAGHGVQVDEQERKWRRFHEDLRASSPQCEVTAEELVWAMECVLSRAFSGPYSGASRPLSPVFLQTNNLPPWPSLCPLMRVVPRVVPLDTSRQARMQKGYQMLRPHLHARRQRKLCFWLQSHLMILTNAHTSGTQRRWVWTLQRHERSLRQERDSPAMPQGPASRVGSRSQPPLQRWGSATRWLHTCPLSRCAARHSVTGDSQCRDLVTRR